MHALCEVDETEQMNVSLETAELLSILQDGVDSSIVVIDKLLELKDRIQDVMNGVDMLELYLNGDNDLYGNDSDIHSYDPRLSACSYFSERLN